MTLKLTYQQACALEQVFTQIIIPEKPADVAESLVKDIMIQAYKKLRNKLESKIKDGYSLSLSDVEGKAYYLYFQKRHLGSSWHYEQIMIENHLTELDKTYA